MAVTGHTGGLAIAVIVTAFYISQVEDSDEELPAR